LLKNSSLNKGVKLKGEETEGQLERALGHFLQKGSEESTFKGWS